MKNRIDVLYRGSVHSSLMTENPCLLDIFRCWVVQHATWTAVLRIERFCSKGAQCVQCYFQLWCPVNPPSPSPCRTKLETLGPNAHRTQDATGMQIRMFFLWCCLCAVWTPPFTSTGPICLRCVALRCVARRVPRPVWIGPGTRRRPPPPFGSVNTPHWG